MATRLVPPIGAILLIVTSQGWQNALQILYSPWYI